MLITGKFDQIYLSTYVDLCKSKYLIENIRGFAKSLLVLDHIQEGKFDDAQKELENEIQTIENDANIAGVKALLAAYKGYHLVDPNWKSYVDLAATGSNVLIKKHVSKRTQGKKMT